MQVRKSVDLTQAEFAEKLGVSPRAYSGYELDERDLPVSIVVKLHESFNVSANWLLLGEGAQSSEDLAQYVEDATIATLEFLDEESSQSASRKDGQNDPTPLQLSTKNGKHLSRLSR